jgi:hypothetical protein
MQPGASGDLAGITLRVSGYLSGDEFTEYSHDIIEGFTGPGLISLTRVALVGDRRTGAFSVPMSNSGFALV